MKRGRHYSPAIPLLKGPAFPLPPDLSCDSAFVPRVPPHYPPRASRRLLRSAWFTPLVRPHQRLGQGLERIDRFQCGRLSVRLVPISVPGPSSCRAFNRRMHRWPSVALLAPSPRRIEATFHPLPGLPGPSFSIVAFLRKYPDCRLFWRLLSDTQPLRHRSTSAERYLPTTNSRFPILLSLAARMWTLLRSFGRCSGLAGPLGRSPAVTSSLHLISRPSG